MYGEINWKKNNRKNAKQLAHVESAWVCVSMWSVLVRVVISHFEFWLISLFIQDKPFAIVKVSVCELKWSSFFIVTQRTTQTDYIWSWSMLLPFAIGKYVLLLERVGVTLFSPYEAFQQNVQNQPHRHRFRRWCILL